MSEFVEQLMQAPLEFLELLGWKAEPESGALQLRLTDGSNLIEEGLQDRVRLPWAGSSHLNHPGQPGGPVGNFSSATRASADGLGDQEPGVHQRPHVMQDRRRVLT